jgi:peptidoglycan/LPS O-acetylase OafA/YrhL
MAHLDGLRAVAVGAVFVAHFGPSVVRDLKIPFGEMGVFLFFCLSGFLITGILLRARDRIHAAEEPLGRALRTFYLRRTLRIFPIFYICLLVTAAINIRPVRETLWWHLTYLSNVQIALTERWPGPVSHLWSLAVEEQFYLVWPWLVLLTPRRWLLPSIVATIALAPLFVVASPMLGIGPLGSYVLTPSCLGALGMGALLALSWERGGPRGAGAVALERIGLLVGMPALVVVVWLLMTGRLDGTNPLWIVSAMSVAFVWVVARCARGFAGAMGPAAALGAVLASAPMVYLGRISYGLYLYHNFMPPFVQRGFAAIGHTESSGTWVFFVACSAASVAVASASWWAIERPLLALKDRWTR